MPHVSKAKLEPFIESFRQIVEKNSQPGNPDYNFQSNHFLKSEEGYKWRLYEKYRYIHDLASSDSGTGDIVKHISMAMTDSMVSDGRRHAITDKNRNPDYIIALGSNVQKSEAAIRGIFSSSDYEKSFSTLSKIFRGEYTPVSFIFFIADPDRFVPAKVTAFNRVFAAIGSRFRLSQRASWENYCSFVEAVSEVQSLMNEALPYQFRLIDAHSFLWMIHSGRISNRIPTSQMQPESTQQQKSVPLQESVATGTSTGTVNVRVGQDALRRKLIEMHGGRCAVTGCSVEGILITSHIKPWSVSNDSERGSVHNALLLTPTLDKLFDHGYITFGDDGNIVISKLLDVGNRGLLGVDENMRIRFPISEAMKGFLSYHRENIFRM